jgi:ATP adenylyltransferase
MNKYPYNNGHLMVVPNRHIAAVEQLRENEFSEIFSLIQKSAKTLKKAIGHHGLNLGLNEGKAAGAGIKDHIHFHVVPRWMGDTNFWPVVSTTKSMPEHLLKTYDRLKKYWK